MGGVIEDLTGKRFGHLLVIAEAERNPKYPKNRNWKLLCDCGREAFALTSVLNLKHKTTCGTCPIHFEGRLPTNKKHGKCHTKLYRIWMIMKYRCKNPKDYGGRGINVCDEWANSFESFASWASISGYKEGLKIERIDSNSNYCPENCTWVTNRTYIRTELYMSSRCKLITYNNEKRTIAEWERVLGFKKTTVFRRLYRGWSAEKALSTPLKGKENER